MTDNLQPTETTEYSDKTLDALDAVMNEEQAPEAMAVADELDDTTLPTEESDATADDDEVQALNLSDFDGEQLVQFGDDKISLSELKDYWDVRQKPELLASRESELTTMRQELEKQKADHSYLSDFDSPHKFIHSALSKMVESEAMPLAVAERLIDTFNGAVNDGLYSVEAVEARAQARAVESDMSAREQALADKEIATQYRHEMALVTAKHGDISEELNKKAFDWVQAEYQKSGVLPTITQAFAKLESQGAFKKAPKSKPKLADSLRRQGTVINPKGGRKQGADDALRALMQP
jgi:hypothetical protein